MNRELFLKELKELDAMSMREVIDDLWASFKSDEQFNNVRSKDLENVVSFGLLYFDVLSRYDGYGGAYKLFKEGSITREGLAQLLQIEENKSRNLWTHLQIIETPDSTTELKSNISQDVFKLIECMTSFRKMVEKDELEKESLILAELIQIGERLTLLNNDLTDAFKIEWDKYFDGK